MSPTKIEWARGADGSPGETWNPTLGCSRVSPGCDHCYAIRESNRHRSNPAFAGLVTTGPPLDWTGVVRCLPERLDIPLRRARPTTWFVDSMSDLFHPDVPDGYIARVWDVMAQTPQHRYQILTKRPQRMADWGRRWADTTGDDRVLDDLGVSLPPMPRGPEAVRATYISPRSRLFADMLDDMGSPPEGAAYPLYDWAEGWLGLPAFLPNVWLGTSIETDRYWFRAEHLRRTPAQIRFLSLEPLLGPLPSLELSGIDWVIIGGESGPGARPMHPTWVRRIIDRCYDAGVPVLFKQWGNWRGQQPGVDWSEPDAWVRLDDGRVGTEAEAVADGGSWAGVWRMAKRAAGRRFDAQVFDEMPHG